MVQPEVAERIAASPAHMSALAVTIQAQATVTLVRRVPRQRLLPAAEGRLGRPAARTARHTHVVGATGSAFTALVQAGFKQPRKQLVNSLADGLAIDKPPRLDLLARAAIEPSRRPQELALDDGCACSRAVADVLYRCYAKINLTLEVLGERQDGFHDLASLVHTIGLADDLRVEPADEHPAAASKDSQGSRTTWSRAPRSCWQPTTDTRRAPS